MKKIALTLCGLLVISIQVFAHPPSDIKIQFDPETKLLSAIIDHRVSNPKTHYINKVDIGLNGKEIQTVVLKEQDNPTEQTIAVPVPEAKKGDVLSVEAYCNLGGKMEKEIKVK